MRPSIALSIPIFLMFVLFQAPDVASQIRNADYSWDSRPLIESFFLNAKRIFNDEASRVGHRRERLDAALRSSGCMGFMDRIARTMAESVVGDQILTIRQEQKIRRCVGLVNRFYYW